MSASVQPTRAQNPRADQPLGTEHSDVVRIRLLYDKHAAPLWRYARRLTGDPVRAEDLAQEALLRAWQHPEIDDDGQRSMRAWLFTVARNMIIDDSRTLRFRSEVSSLDCGELANPAGADEMNAVLDRLLVGAALARLSVAHRAVIRRSFYQGLTTAQIAQDLHVPEGTVKSRVHSAVRALRVAFNEMGVTR
jgi:RNA polymerase sigma-70 factor, ECF subfamily